MDNRSFQGFRFEDLERATKSLNLLLAAYDDGAEEYQAEYEALESVFYIKGIISYLSLKRDVDAHEPDLTEGMMRAYRFLGHKFSHHVKNADKTNAFSPESLVNFKKSIETFESLRKSMIQEDPERYATLEIATSVMRYLSQENIYGLFNFYLEEKQHGLTEEELEAYCNWVDPDEQQAESAY